MPRRFYNWTFRNAQEFLKRHGFRHIHTRGSHYYFHAKIKGRDYIVEVPRHGNQVIKPRTLKHSIAHKSGIPARHWLTCQAKKCRQYTSRT